MIWIWLSLASAQTVENEVLTRAAEVWSAQAGRASTARERGAQQSAARLGLGPSSLFVNSQVGERVQRQLEVGVDLPLDLGLAQRAVKRTALEVTKQQTRFDRFESQLDAHDAWSRWWTVHAVLDHVEEHAVELQTQMAPFLAGLDTGAVSPAMLADLQTGSWLVQGELLGLRRTVADQEAVVQLRLGAGPLPRGPDLEAPLPENSPWGETPPPQRVLVADTLAQARQAEATQAGLAKLPVLQGGAMWAPNDEDQLVPFAVLGFTLPLQAGHGAERQRLRGEAFALHAEAEWQTLQFEQQWALEHRRWLELRDEITQRREQVVTPLETRAERLREAAAQGLVPLSRWVQASRDHREAEHQAVLLQAELLRSSSRARALKVLLENS